MVWDLLLGNVATQLQSSICSDSKNFWCPNTITNNLFGRMLNQAEGQDKRDEIKNSSEQGQEIVLPKDIWFVYRNGGVGGYRRGTGGGGTR